MLELLKNHGDVLKKTLLPSLRWPPRWWGGGIAWVLKEFITHVIATKLLRVFGVGWLLPQSCLRDDGTLTVAFVGGRFTSTTKRHPHPISLGGSPNIRSPGLEVVSWRSSEPELTCGCCGTRFCDAVLPCWVRTLGFVHNNPSRSYKGGGTASKGNTGGVKFCLNFSETMQKARCKWL